MCGISEGVRKAFEIGIGLGDLGNWKMRLCFEWFTINRKQESLTIAIPYYSEAGITLSLGILIYLTLKEARVGDAKAIIDKEASPLY